MTHPEPNVSNTTIPLKWNIEHYYGVSCTPTNSDHAPNEELTSFIINPVLQQIPHSERLHTPGYYYNTHDHSLRFRSILTPKLRIYQALESAPSTIR